MPTTASDLAAGAVAMVGEARFTIEHQAVFTNTVVQMKMAQGEKSIYIPKFGIVTCEDLTDGIDMSNAQTMAITGTTHTTDEAGCKVIVTKRLKNQLKADAFRAAGKVIGNAMQKKIDTDGLSLFSGLDSGLSNANSSFSIGYFAAAVTQCRGQSEPSPDPMSCVAHPYMLHPLVDAISYPAANYPMPPGFQMSVLQDHLLGVPKLYRTPIFSDANASIDTSGDTYGAIYSKAAFIYVTGYEIEHWVVYDDSLRGWEIGIVHDYAMVEEDGTYGQIKRPYSNRAKRGTLSSSEYGNLVLNKMCRDYTPDCGNTEEIVRPCRKLQETGRNDQSPRRRSNKEALSSIRRYSPNELGEGAILIAS